MPSRWAPFGVPVLPVPHFVGLFITGEGGILQAWDGDEGYVPRTESFVRHMPGVGTGRNPYPKPGGVEVPPPPYTGAGGIPSEDASFRHQIFASASHY